jgi:polar amino acid transport system substrate-binding protein
VANHGWGLRGLTEVCPGERRQTFVDSPDRFLKVQQRQPANRDERPKEMNDSGHAWASRRGTAKIAALLVMALAAALLIAACGSSKSSSSAGSSTSPTAAAGVAVAGVTITPDASLNAMLPASVKSAGVLRVATDIPYPPFEMYADANNTQPTGFDYDLGQALAAKLGLHFQFDQIVFDSIIPALSAGKADMVLAAMVDNKAREQVLSFVDYAKVGSVLLTVKGNPHGLTTLNGLAGKTVAAQSGTIQAQMLTALAKQFAAAGKPALKVLTFPKDSDALLAVQAGKAVADYVQLPDAAYTQKTAGNGSVYQTVVDPAAPGGYAPSIIGAGVVKSDTALTGAVQKALQGFIADGTYGKILAKYGLAGSAVSSAQVNQG